MNKAELFVNHIEEHLISLNKRVPGDYKVICKICQMTIDDIYDKYQYELDYFKNTEDWLKNANK